jgi:hypothetical protein
MAQKFSEDLSKKDEDFGQQLLNWGLWLGIE